MRELDPRRDWGEGELDLALRQPRCPACLLGEETEQAVLSWVAKVNIREAATIRKVVDSRGLCATHWRALARRTDARSSRAFVRLLESVAAQVERDLSEDSGVDLACPVCGARERRERGAILQILDRLDDPSERAAYERSFGVCQPHLVDAVRTAAEPRAVRALVAIQRSQVARLAKGSRAGPKSAGAEGGLTEKLAGAHRR